MSTTDKKESRRESALAWDLPVGIADAIEPALPGLGAEIIDTISIEVPEYARPLEGSFGRGVRRGVEEALRQFVATVRDPESGRGSGRDIYIQLGRGELRQGRSLDSLLSAYRVGARVAWRRLSHAAEQAGVPSGDIYSLADAIFAYIDELSAESAEGFAAEQSARQDQARVRRERLLTALAAGVSRDELEPLARSANWGIPTHIAMAACEADELGDLARRAGPGAVAAVVDGRGCMALKDSDATMIVDNPGGPVAERRITVGPTLALRDASRSWREAVAADDARTSRRFGSPHGVLRSEDWLTELVFVAGTPYLARLSERLLAPLREETPASQQRLLETLESWLANSGAVGPTAVELNVHQQTVRYRVARLRELFPGIDDPDMRFQLQMILRADATLERR